ncbi:MAG: hypothetical protein P1U82_04625, partial [Verrucomicrobiales bacterium]|nr:hypothetical protein [Verrucomicrobiales bacterium]
HRRNGKTYGKRKVRDYLFRPEFELYDLSSDPNEQTNLAKVKNHSGRLDRLKKTLKAFQVRTKDPWLIMWDNDAQLQGSGTGL